ncbi:MAG: Crp/Fnr family transcriptional regulator [Leadbetterella sp.]|nr:Crp/Fnr family transcriptional regulator [Leadbetterella sp.]
MNSFDPIFKEIRKYITLNHETVHLIIPHLKRKKYLKNEVLLHLGERSDKIFFIVKGVIREFFINRNGDDLTTQIVAESNFFYSTVSYHSGQPSYRIVEALEDCEAICIEKHNFIALVNQIPELLHLNLQILEHTLLNFEQRSELWKIRPASLRLEMFLLKYPFLANRVSKKYIASFLNINPSTFSRIKFLKPGHL